MNIGRKQINRLYRHVKISCNGLELKRGFAGEIRKIAERVRAEDTDVDRKIWKSELKTGIYLWNECGRRPDELFVTMIGVYSR